MGGRSPVTYIGRSHTYVYYPIPWTDSSTGTDYQAGYYDENGTRYDQVSFKDKDGTYKNVLCECEYCGTQKIMDVTGDKTLECANCGGTMKMVGAVDEILDNNGSGSGQSPFGGGFDVDTGRSRMSLSRIIGWIIAAYVILTFIFGFIRSATSSYYYESPSSSYEYGYEDEDSWDGGYAEEYASNTELFGETIHLSQNGDGAYVIDEGGLSKTLVWYDDYESYYDAESDCYLWYNNEADPAVWQYWYEGISSDYGEYGWMEYEDGVWYIEKSYGTWIELPARYDTSALWHMEQ